MDAIEGSLVSTTRSSPRGPPPQRSILTDSSSINMSRVPAVSSRDPWAPSESLPSSLLGRLAIARVRFEVEKQAGHIVDRPHRFRRFDQTDTSLFQGTSGMNDCG
jgi:hypothetical protein